MADVELEGLACRYGATVAVAGVDLAVERGELLSLLGPSGCGKTTTLRMVAGFVRPSAGTVRLRGRDVTRMAPHRRDTGMVFQGYALFPHLSVADNIAFGLRRRRLPKAEVRARVARMLEMLRLGELSDRRPAQLSGGQQQRVAVARALAIEPTVLLLDEPFSALDTALREATRQELRALQRRLGMTTILVTHDQHEALSLSDRVAVMQGGRLAQLGTPREVYEHPRTRFVAGFIGHANLLPAGLLRPERIRMDAAGAGGVPGTVEQVAYYGASADVLVCVDSPASGLPDRLLVRTDPEAALRHAVGAAVRLSWPEGAIVPLEEQ